MSFALNFTQDINDISTMKQKPLRKAPGGAIPSDKIISEAPPKDISTEEKILTYKGPTSMSDTPNVFYPGQEMEMGQRPYDDFMQRYMMTYGAPGSSQEFEVKKSMGKVMTPDQLGMIMDAQKNKEGIIQLLEAKAKTKSPLQELIDILGKTEYNL